ncbi:hypothetical protein BJV74DRAFT_280935 [Russula compacta]|nr:hypothetical protein BJV74DRAFT_280935 [Russula compacta]
MMARSTVNGIERGESAGVGSSAVQAGYILFSHAPARCSSVGRHSMPWRSGESVIASLRPLPRPGSRQQTLSSLNDSGEKEPFHTRFSTRNVFPWISPVVAIVFLTTDRQAANHAWAWHAALQQRGGYAISASNFSSCRTSMHGTRLSLWTNECAKYPYQLPHCLSPFLCDEPCYAMP